MGKGERLGYAVRAADSKVLRSCFGLEFFNWGRSSVVLVPLPFFPSLSHISLFPIYQGMLMRNVIAKSLRLPWLGWLSAGLCSMGMAAAVHAVGFDTAAVKVTPLLQTDVTWAGQPFKLPQQNSELQVMEITLMPGGETGWHTHPVSSFAYVLDGELEISLEDGRQHRAQPGQALAEVVGLKHNGRNVGQGPVRLVVFYLSEPGTTLTEKATAP